MANAQLRKLVGLIKLSEAGRVTFGKEYFAIPRIFTGPSPKNGVNAYGSVTNAQGDLVAYPVDVEYNAPTLDIKGLENIITAHGWDTSTVVSVKCSALELENGPVSYSLYFEEVPDCDRCPECGRTFDLLLRGSLEPVELW